ncbi:MAG: DUF2059 domain-containing protein [Acidobacteriota bacterium]
MMIKTMKLALLLMLSGLLFSTVARAQEAIKPEKRALIKQLLTLVQADKIAEQVTSVLLKQFEERYQEMLAQALANAPELSKEEREKAARRAPEVSAWALKRIRELMIEKIDFAGFMEQSAYPLYDKYFTEEELKDLVAFYETPTGQKSIKVMPALFQESFQKAQEWIGPKIIELVTGVMREAVERLTK